MKYANVKQKSVKPGTQLSFPVGTPHRKAKDGSRRGGRRPGAGRKPNGKTAMVSHARRPAHKAVHPLHLSMKVASDVPSLRQPRFVKIITCAMRQVHATRRAGASSQPFRIVEFSVQATHVHLVAEARDKRSLTRGMASFAIRIARAINRTLGRRGPVWRDRYYARRLTVPKEVRNALVYVLFNSSKHKPTVRGIGRRQASLAVLADAHCTSARWFQGFSPECTAELGRAARSPSAASTLTGPCGKSLHVPPVAAAATWLLAIGWRRHGLIDPRRDAPS